MKFFITRTSTDYNEKPCDEAVEETYTRVDRRTASDPLKIPALRDRRDDLWYGQGANHRVENDMITRDFPGEKAWMIEIESLEHLLALQQKYGDLIIRGFLFSPDQLAIEIYDDHRE